MFLVDISVYKHGFHSDLNETFFVGNVDQKSRDLVRTTYECLEKAIEMSKSLESGTETWTKFAWCVVRPGTKYRDVGNVIQKHATANGCSVVRSYCGHGIHK